MKKVAIIYYQSLTQIQGINYVNNSFVMGGKYFKESGLELTKIYAPDGVFDCRGKERLDLIGSNIHTAAYRRERKIRVFLRELLSSKFLLGASIKLYFNSFRHAQKAVKRYLKDEEQADYIIFQDFLSAYYYKQARKSDDKTGTILILHSSAHPLEQSMPTFSGFYRYERLKNWMCNRCFSAMKEVDKVVYLSNHAKSVSFLPDDHKAYIFNGVEDIQDLTVYDVHSPLNLVCVASVIDHKGQKVIIGALTYLQKEVLEKVHLTLVGGGDELDLCKKLVVEKGLGKYVTILGPRNDVAEILKEMDVFILPSKSEGMPMSIIEAMRQGLYVMATETGGIPEMIEKGCGELIKRDEEQIAMRLNYIVHDGMLTRQNKELARQRFEQEFTLKTMIDRYSKVLLSL